MFILSRSRVALSGSIVAVFTIVRVFFDQRAISAIQRRSDEMTHAPGSFLYEGVSLSQPGLSLRTNTSRPDPTRVLVVGYMRGGSSFMGDVFNQHEKVFYWYEPLDGVYSALFGTPFGWTPLDISHTLDGEPRRLSSTEEEAIVSSLSHIYNCDFAALPTEVLTHRFVDGTLSYGQSDFAGCLYYIENFPTKTSEDCKSYLQSICPQSFEDPRTFTCYESLNKGLPKPRNTTSSNDNYTDDGLLSNGQIGRFHDHGRCLKEVRKGAMACLAKLTKKCQEATAIVVKTIRMRVQTVELLLRRFPRMKVVHVLRDPVPIVLSRYRNKLMSAASGGMVITEAVVMCAKIADDIRHRRALERLWPRSFLTVDLDDFAKKPLERLNDVYMNVLERARPLDVSFWVEQTYKNEGNQFVPCMNFTPTFNDEEADEFAMEYCYEGFLQNLKKACQNYYVTKEDASR